MPGGMRIPCRNCGHDVGQPGRRTCATCETTVAQVTLRIAPRDPLVSGAWALFDLHVESTASHALGDVHVDIEDRRSVFEHGSNLAASRSTLKALASWDGDLDVHVSEKAFGTFRLPVLVRYRDEAGLQWRFRGKWIVHCQALGHGARDGRAFIQIANAQDDAVAKQDQVMHVEGGGERGARASEPTGAGSIDLALEDVQRVGGHARAGTSHPPEPPPPTPEPRKPRPPRKPLRREGAGKEEQRRPDLAAGKIGKTATATRRETSRDTGGILEPMDCPACGHPNPAGGKQCHGCRQPLPITPLAGFTLTEAGAKEATVAQFEHVGAMVREFAGRVRAPTDQLLGRDEARLHRVLSRLAAELGEKEFRLFTWSLGSRLGRLQSPGRDVVRRAVHSVVRAVATPRDSGCPGQPVFLQAEFEPNVRQNLALLTLIVERLPGAPISRAEVEIQAPQGIERVIKVVPPEETSTSLVEVTKRRFPFQVELHGSGTARLPVRVRLSCREEGADRTCACCYRTQFLWQVGVDERHRTVVNKLQVIEPDTSIVRVDFGGAADERTTLDEEDDDANQTLSRQARFDLPLSLDVPALKRQSDELYGSSPAMVPTGDTRIRAAHFLVRAGDRRRILFVLLDEALTLGRSQRNHVVTRYGGLGDERHWSFVSRRQAELRWRGVAEGSMLTDGFGAPSTNPTRVRRKNHKHDLQGKSMRVVHGDQFQIPPRGGDVQHPYLLDLRAAHTWDLRKRELRVLSQIIAPAAGVHRPLEHAQPFLYCWLPAADHEALVGFHPDLAARLPGPGPDQAFRLLRDERGHLFVSPCSGVSLTLTRGSLTRTLQPHAWYYLADEDELRCGEATLTFNVHPHVGDDPPDLGGCYLGERGPFDPPDDFRAMLLALMVRNPA